MVRAERDPHPQGGTLWLGQVGAQPGGFSPAFPQVYSTPPVPPGSSSQRQDLGEGQGQVWVHVLLLRRGRLGFISALGLGSGTL